MIKTARLSIKYAGQDEGSGDMKKELEKAMVKAGVVMADIELKNGNGYSGNTHFGNWVLTPVLDNEASKKLADIMGTELDMQDSILELSDLVSFKVGQAVSVKFLSDFGFRVNDIGKVYNINSVTGEISILKKGKRKLGWNFRAGDRVEITSL